MAITKEDQERYERYSAHEHAMMELEEAIERARRATSLAGSQSIQDLYRVLDNRAREVFSVWGETPRLLDYCRCTECGSKFELVLSPNHERVIGLPEICCDCYDSRHEIKSALREYGYRKTEGQ